MRAAMCFLPLALVAAACAPFDPSLGDSPFLCGPDEPRCPEGYGTVTVTSGTSTRCECHRTDTTGQSSTPDGDYTCNNDPIENNDAVATATPTAIGTNNTTAYNDIAVCPATDVDYYSMNIVKAGTIIRVDVMYDQARPTPVVDIVNAQNVSLHPTLAANMPGKLTAGVTVPATGTFYALVKAGTAAKSVNYSIDFLATPPP